MVTGRADQKTSVTGYLLASLLLCVVATVAIKWYQKTTDCFTVRPSLGGFVFTIEVTQQKMLIEETRKFADKHRFKFETVYYTPQENNFMIDMKRKDIQVVISNIPADLDKFYVDFYNYDCAQPTLASDVADLVRDLKSFISELPNVVVSEK